jgi:hypothetical protein
MIDYRKLYISTIQYNDYPLMDQNEGELSWKKKKITLRNC